MKALSYIGDRLREPSTWAGLSSLVTGLGVAVSPDRWQEIMAIGMGIGGFLAVIVKEPKE